jgi:RNA polymerase sigma-70 factor (family 1)
MAAINTLSDQELLTRFRVGDEEAYAEIYRRYIIALVRFAESKLFNLEEARDLIQDLFMHLWRDREVLRIDINLKSWLFANARHRIIDHIRKNVVREGYCEKLKTLSPAFHSLEEELNARELQARINNKLEELPEKTQKIYHNRENGKTVRQIAEELNLSDQTVKNQLSIAMKHLKSSLTSFLFLFL